MKEHHCTSIVPLFNHLSEEEQDKIESLVIHCHFNKGETVWQPGDEPLLIIVASGSMKVYMIAGNGREQLLRLLTPGSYEGANALLGARAQDLFIDTLEATDACLLRKSDFTALLEKTPKLALKLLEINAQRMADTENQTRFLMMERVETRLSAYLLSLYLLSGGAADLEIPMKMKDLSAYLGTTPETLSRKLHLLEETNLISRKGKKIHIADRDGLKQMAEGVTFRGFRESRRFLRLMGPLGPKVLRFDGPLARRLWWRHWSRTAAQVQRVVDSRFAAMFIKTALRDSLPTLRVILNEVKNLGAGSL